MGSVPFSSGKNVEALAGGREVEVIEPDDSIRHLGRGILVQRCRLTDRWRRVELPDRRRRGQRVGTRPALRYSPATGPYDQRTGQMDSGASDMHRPSYRTNRTARRPRYGSRAMPDKTVVAASCDAGLTMNSANVGYSVRAAMLPRRNTMSFQ